VNGDVRFFGSNLRATHNLAHNIGKAIKESSWSGFEQPTATLARQLVVRDNIGRLLELKENSNRSRREE